MSAAPTLTIWVDGIGRSRADVERVLVESALQAAPGTDFVCLVAANEEDSADWAVDAEVLLVPLPDDDAAVLNRLLSQTRSDWVVWIDASARLAPGALAHVESAVARFDIDLLYGDSRLPGSRRTHRPAFSTIRLRSQDYLGDVRGFRVEALLRRGGFGAGHAGAHPLDLSLRLGSDAARVLRIPEILSVSAMAIRPSTERHRKVVAQFLGASDIVAEVTVVAGGLQVNYPLMSAPLVSIIIPTRGSRARIHGAESVLVVDAVRGILERSTYASLEFVVVADDETPQSVIDDLVCLAGDALRVVRWSEDFNFSAKMNRGAIFARGDYLVLLNDDVDLITPDWIETMLGLAQQPGVGLVGSLLFFEDGTVQHGGHVYSASWAGHIAFGWPADRDDDLGSMGVEREVSGVTAACAMIRADTFWQLGGLSLDYAGNYNDVDLSLKVRTSGRSIIWTPHARLYHFESKSRIATVEPAELATLRAHWGTWLLSDPYWPSSDGQP
ncbi:glycosyltransferase family 2 protein [Glaciihabitans sp. GrIS 2.15]|uniref:glycosyltransferase family 2 protein n=1 Tax=Glaciihabitans sp. GrIS 2.15 TaxID=3071710 RepID=UPI002E0BD7FE|nr:GT2 family glycosyltransferase [Glaciihabitans sp. GrIS 2.15]